MMYNPLEDREPLEFQIFWKDELVGYVKYDYKEDKLIAESYSSDYMKMPWLKGLKVDNEFIYNFLLDRCFPETRVNCDEILHALGLEVYDPIEITKRTHGLLMEDFMWIRYVGEEVTYEDIKIRD